MVRASRVGRCRVRRCRADVGGRGSDLGIVQGPDDHVAVAHVASQQLVVRAHVGDRAVLQEGDLVGVVQHQRRHRHGDRGPAPPVLGQPARDHRLRVGVHRRGRLDQHQDLGVGRQRAGQHQPLALTARQPATALVDDALPAARHQVEHVLGRRGQQRLLGLLPAQAPGRVDRVLQRAGEHARPGVADQDHVPDVTDADIGEVDGAEGHTPPTTRELGVASLQPGPLLVLAAPGPAGGPAGQPVLDVQTHRVVIARQVAAESIRQLRRVLRACRKRRW